MDTIGYHYIVEASNCDPRTIEDATRLREILVAAAKTAQMDVKVTHFFKFTPRGVSGIVIVSASHISIHTWPEERYAAIDVYTCGDDSQPEKAIEYILGEIGAEHAHITEIKRGVKDNGEFTHTILTWEESLRRG